MASMSIAPSNSSTKSATASACSSRSRPSSSLLIGFVLRLGRLRVSAQLVARRGAALPTILILPAVRWVARWLRRFLRLARTTLLRLGARRLRPPRPLLRRRAAGLRTGLLTPLVLVVVPLLLCLLRAVRHPCH